MAEEKVGVVTHYFGKIGVAAVKITDGVLSVGDRIHVRGHTSDFTQTVESMQLEHDAVQVARAGEEIGLRMTAHAHEHDLILKVTSD
jgi:translation elongation factor EF-1alpha